MKETPQSISRRTHRVNSYQTSTTPYREVLRVKQEDIPIRRQCFPTPESAMELKHALQELNYQYDDKTKPLDSTTAPSPSTISSSPAISRTPTPRVPKIAPKTSCSTPAPVSLFAKSPNLGNDSVKYPSEGSPRSKSGSLTEPPSDASIESGHSSPSPFSTATKEPFLASTVARRSPTPVKFIDFTRLQSGPSHSRFRPPSSFTPPRGESLSSSTTNLPNDSIPTTPVPHTDPTHVVADGTTMNPPPLLSFGTNPALGEDTKAFPKKSKFYMEMVQSAPHLRIQRIRQKIRCRNTTQTCFKSAGKDFLDVPPQCDEVQVGDIFTHRSGGSGSLPQVWTWGAGGWLLVRPYEDRLHPVFKEYHLWMRHDGEPRWLLSKTITTYRGRQRKEDRD
ncbi:hypothetical protein BJ138DRAFT_1147781 [Hygrophoropsis aurantiaca]|uniref:Uncharacterized protein n=1 Tax=Hygrophoropsis aurantiaca TaxID=72124 RepID=A0ACB8AI70_9AGAM|nr:hypothetical protein BJ138DRAFT_1147781 [Hygrophoropsis aurantiaca]